MSITVKGTVEQQGFGWGTWALVTEAGETIRTIPTSSPVTASWFASSNYRPSAARYSDSSGYRTGAGSGIFPTFSGE